ncbi:MAG: hypothetical protein AB1640_09855 [bacterium]
MIALAALLAVHTGCAGDGTQEPESQIPLEPTLPAIQANIFTPVCAVPGCHAGAGAPLGQRLDSVADSFNSIVGVLSVERSDLMLYRVDPGDPDNSYLVWKIEGRPDIEGARMPLGQPPLSQEQISAVREWIQNGAPEAPP